MVSVTLDDAVFGIGLRMQWPRYRCQKCVRHVKIDTINYQRTSDSLNEGLSIKMTREKFQRKQYFFSEKDSRFNPRLIPKSSFLIGQVPIEKYGLKTLFMLFNI